MAAALTAALLMSRAAPADGEVRKDSGFSGMAYFTAGIGSAELGPLRARMKAHGYPLPSDTFAALGGGGLAFFKRLVLGVEVYALLGHGGKAELLSGPHDVSVSGGCGFFNIGCLVLGKGRLRVYPLFGIGAGSMTLRMRTETPLPFEAILENPRGEAVLTTSGFLLNLSLGAHTFLRLGQGPKGETGLFLAARAGYVWSPERSPWEIGTEEVPDSPKAGFSGPSVKIIIGFGRGGKN